MKNISRTSPWASLGFALWLAFVTASLSYGSASVDPLVNSNPEAANSYVSTTHASPVRSKSSSRTIASEAVAPLFSVADAYVRGGNYRSENYGQDTLLLVKKVADNPSYVRRSYLKFDIAALPASFTSVVLRLHISRADGTDQHSISLVPGSNWTEGAITWNNKPAAAPEPLASWTTGAAGETVSIDLTTAIRNEQAAGRSVVSFVLHRRPVIGILATLVVRTVTRQSGPSWSRLRKQPTQGLKPKVW